jgi:hypothetical protein
MSESLSKRVAQFMQTRPARRSGKGRATVIALREQIREALNDGWSVKAVWQTLHTEGAVQVGYHAFRRHVAELVLAQASDPKPAPTQPAPTAPESARPAWTTEDSRVFKHSRVPRKSEIYG